MKFAHQQRMHQMVLLGILLHLLQHYKTTPAIPFSVIRSELQLK